MATVIGEQIIVSSGTEYVTLTEHNYASNPDEITYVEFKSKINVHAISSNDVPRRIIRRALLEVDLNDASAVPNYKNAQCLVEPKRKKNAIPLSTPTTFAETEITEEFKLINVGDMFLLYDNEKNDNRIIVLSSRENMTRYQPPIIGTPMESLRLVEYDELFRRECIIRLKTFL
ncbi:unnamed protein product [Adineta ricciae]|uniref:Uncharacterized protein n=1 Tax=Adineta ricciae TaxID=249248 RepID=A0A814PVW5_ADIRI|nr:unnamed protein product [Adineta ricciae]